MIFFFKFLNHEQHHEAIVTHTHRVLVGRQPLLLGRGAQLQLQLAQVGAEPAQVGEHAHRAPGVVGAGRLQQTVRAGQPAQAGHLRQSEHRTLHVIDKDVMLMSLNNHEI